MRNLISLVAMAPGVVFAQSEPHSLPETAFLAVEINGSLNLRLEPSEEAGRVTRLRDGTLLRRIDCGLFGGTGGPASGWCEVESLDGGTAGWASAAFLAPYFGADPEALTTLAVAPDQQRQVGAGTLSGTLPSAGIEDHLIAVPEGAILQIAADTLPENIAAIVFDDTGAALLRIAQAGDSQEIEFTNAGTAVLRLLETGGMDGLYAVSIRFD
ncbi:SH3 domain-containing protein [Pseudoruegeria sp. SHC-113]|uniref:SH3 domain-containing protein n=1 Tax=Pseudoruegeria sp. SHC-113 TaxID=2855439 RepID=UPI0021BAADBC|nr:SH3 domain-containing protein [Pseudoruegeria sp. SHC-113]MCT8161735.1 SH3 domain-containing protein [Pseudoruegeria sp. SHC-113]